MIAHRDDLALPELEKVAEFMALTIARSPREPDRDPRANLLN